MPYIGYFQLIYASDIFVIYDDVQYIKSGWVNRNRILLNSEPNYFTISLKKDSTFLNINEKIISNNFILEKDSILRKFEQAYKKAPYYLETIEIIKKIFYFNDNNLSNMIVNSIKEICLYLNIETKILLSSNLEKNKLEDKKDKLINICNILKANKYINPIGGTELYNKDDFKLNEIDLYFLKTRKITYKQFNNTFIPNLSIIDILMFNPKDKIKEYLMEYDLI